MSDDRSAPGAKSFPTGGSAEAFRRRRSGWAPPRAREYRLLEIAARAGAAAFLSSEREGNAGLHRLRARAHGRTANRPRSAAGHRRPLRRVQEALAAAVRFARACASRWNGALLRWGRGAGIGMWHAHR